MQVLVEDEDELLRTHLRQDDGLGEGVDEELLSVGLEREELGEDRNLLEEQQAVLVVALAAVPQDP